MGIHIRAAVPADVNGIFTVRTSVNENILTREALQDMGITEATVREMIEAELCTWVALDGEIIIGFSMILSDEGCLFAAFVLPTYEGRGIGKALVDVAEQQLFLTHEQIWLETEKHSRAAGFYQRLGWVQEAELSGGDARFIKQRSSV
jgi:GNAT superfamily N-acetyltransferase